jgi:hypothetical protein
MVSQFIFKKFQNHLKFLLKDKFILINLIFFQKSVQIHKFHLNYKFLLLKVKYIINIYFKKEYL